MSYILVVDDDEDLLELVCRMVEFNKMEAKCLASGSEIFPSLESERFDVVLMDVFIGKYDGRELTRTIKSDERFKHIPVLLYSAGTIDPASISECKADGFLQKPFNMHELIMKLEHLLAGRHYSD